MIPNQFNQIKNISKKLYRKYIYTHEWDEIPTKKHKMKLDEFSWDHMKARDTKKDRWETIRPHSATRAQIRWGEANKRKWCEK